MAGAVGTHTSCLTSQTGVISYFPNPVQISSIVSIHNQVRSSVDPPGTDLRAVLWDLGLASSAQKWAEYTVPNLASDCSNCRKLVNNRSINVGQNTYILDGASYDQNSFWSTVIGSWSNQSSNFLYGSPSGSKTGKFFEFMSLKTSFLVPLLHNSNKILFIDDFFTKKIFHK